MEGGNFVSKTFNVPSAVSAQFVLDYRSAGLRLGWDETGARASRLTDRFVAHPNVIKRLGLGEAIIVSQRPQFEVRRVRVRPSGIAARAHDSSDRALRP